MKFSIFAIALALVSGSAFAAKNPGGLEVCSKEVPFKEIYKEGETLKNLYGICNKNSNKEKWIVEPSFARLTYSETSKVYYGWKYNDPTGKSDFNRTKDDAQKYGYLNSTVFNANGSKRFDIPGKIDQFENGLGSIFVGEEPTVLGLDRNDIQSSSTAKTIAMGYLGVDFVLAALSSTIQYTLLMDEPLYDHITTRHFKTQRVGFVDLNRKMVIEPKFLPSNWTTTFKSDYAVVMGDNKLYGLINKQGEYVLEPKYKFLSLSSYFLHQSSKTDKEAYVAKDVTCGFFTCTIKKELLDRKTLKVIDTSEKNSSKFFIMKVINREDGAEISQDNVLIVGIIMSLMGAIVLWPFCIAYQRSKKKASWKKSIFAGFGWGWLITVGAVVGTFILLIFVVMIFISGGMLGTMLAQKD